MFSIILYLNFTQGPIMVNVMDNVCLCLLVVDHVEGKWVGGYGQGIVFATPKVQSLLSFSSPRHLSLSLSPLLTIFSPRDLSMWIKNSKGYPNLPKKRLGDLEVEQLGACDCSANEF